VLKPKSVILDLLSPRGARPMSAAAMVEACALFGISGNAARVTLVRLCAERRLERVSAGTYVLTRFSQPLNRHVREWSRLEDLTRPWDGAWITTNFEDATARARANRTRVMRHARFALAAPTLAVRPNNLQPRPEEHSTFLIGLGLEGPFVVARSEIADPAVAERWARSLWPVQKLRGDHDRLAARVEAGLIRLARIPFERGLVESFTLGGEAIRALVLDPLLPEEIMPGASRARLLAAMIAYDRAGRALWRRFNARFEDSARTDLAPFDTETDSFADN